MGSPDSSQAPPATTRAIGKQQQRITIRQADKRRLRGLRRIHHPDDTGIGAFACRCPGPNFEGLAGVDRTAPRRLSLPARDRDRLAGQRRLIDHGAGTQNDPVDRDYLAGAHQNDVAHDHLFNWNVSDRRSLTTMGNSRSAIDQRLQVALGAGDGKVLQHIAACIHHGDNDPGQILAKGKSRGHRDESDGVDPHAPRQEVSDHGDEQTENNGRSARSPNPICEFIAANAPGEQTKKQSTQSGDNQGSSEKALCKNYRHP